MIERKGDRRASELAGYYRDAQTLALIAKHRMKIEPDVDIWYATAFGVDGYLSEAGATINQAVAKLIATIDAAMLAKKEPKLMCEKCGANRFKETCRQPQDFMKCPMMGTAAISAQGEKK